MIFHAVVKVTVSSMAGQARNDQREGGVGIENDRSGSACLVAILMAQTIYKELANTHFYSDVLTVLCRSVERFKLRWA